MIPLAGSASANATVTVKATRGGNSTYYTPERTGEGFAVDIPVPATGGPVTTELEVNAVRFDAGWDMDLVKTVTGSYTTAHDAMTYDADGNLTSWNGWTFTWNGENRLTVAVKGTQRLEFDYDYMGRRIFKKVYADNVLTKHLKFVYDGYKLIEVRDALNGNALTLAIAWQPETAGLDVPVALMSGSDWGYSVTDGNKNVTRVVAQDGAALAEYTYGPFGQILSMAGSWAIVNPFRFSSEYHDDETALVYYNYRYYSPVLGRWLSRDPIEEKGGVNLYGMVGNNVVDFIDQLGQRFGMVPDESDFLIIRLAYNKIRGGERCGSIIRRMLDVTHWYEALGAYIGWNLGVYHWFVILDDGTRLKYGGNNEGEDRWSAKAYPIYLPPGKCCRDFTKCMNANWPEDESEYNPITNNCKSATIGNVNICL